MKNNQRVNAVDGSMEEFLKQIFDCSLRCLRLKKEISWYQIQYNRGCSVDRQALCDAMNIIMERYEKKASDIISIVAEILHTEEKEKTRLLFQALREKKEAARQEDARGLSFIIEDIYGILTEEKTAALKEEALKNELKKIRAYEDQLQKEKKNLCEWKNKEASQ